MKLWKKKSKQKRGAKGKDSLVVRQMRILLWRLFTRFKCRERIAKANAWADGHRKETAAITIACLTLLLVIGTISTFSEAGEDEQDSNFMSGIAPVNPMFRGLQHIQDAKSYQVSQMEGLALKGKAIKHELDSLVSLPFKTKKDSTEIIIRYRQLEMIVRNLKNG